MHRRSFPAVRTGGGGRSIVGGAALEHNVGGGCGCRLWLHRYSTSVARERRNLSRQRERVPLCCRKTVAACRQQEQEPQRQRRRRSMQQQRQPHQQQPPRRGKCRRFFLPGEVSRQHHTLPRGPLYVRVMPPGAVRKGSWATGATNLQVCWHRAQACFGHIAGAPVQTAHRETSCSWGDWVILAVAVVFSASQVKRRCGLSL